MFVVGFGFSDSVGVVLVGEGSIEIKVGVKSISVDPYSKRQVSICDFFCNKIGFAYCTESEVETEVVLCVGKIDFEEMHYRTDIGARVRSVNVSV